MTRNGVGRGTAPALPAERGSTVLFLDDPVGPSAAGGESAAWNDGTDGTDTAAGP